MRFAIRLSSILVFLLLRGAFAQTPPEDNQSLADIAREARERKRLNPSDESTHSAVVRELIAGMNEGRSINDPVEYGRQLAELLTRRDFDGLEHEADMARSSKSRFPGGPWKLYDFYDTLGQPSRGSKASDADWSAHLALLKEWVSGQHQSSTARIALAQAYLNYGGKARGGGYANTVTAEGWQLYGDRADLALASLKEAAALPVKCPFWYFAMLRVAMAQAWSRPQAKALLDGLISFEPSFYHFYRQFAIYLQPKWYGEEGEAEAFADSISQTLGGEEGAFVYFEIVTALNCGPCSNASTLANFSWPKIKQGYAALENLYGTSKLKMNRFAFLAVNVQDKASAKQVFALIGDDWDPEVWRNQEMFKAAKVWAMN